MMGPYVYEEARASAPMHLQILRTGSARRPPGSSSVRLRGRIVRVFRDRERTLHWLQFVEFSVPVIDRERTGSPQLSGTIFHDWERMGRARWFEVFLESWQGELQLVHSQICAIRRPTRLPVCGPDVKGFVCPGNF